MLHVANCVDFMKNEMQPESVDLTITSPPYDDLRTYNGYEFDFEAIANQLFRVTKEGGVVVWVVADKTVDGGESGASFRQAIYFQDIGFRLFDTMIYAKQPKGAVGTSSNRYFQCFEYMFVLSKGTPNTTNLIRDRENKCKDKVWQDKYVRNTDGTKQYIQDKNECPVYSKRTNIWQYFTGNNLTTKDKIAFEHPAIFPEKLAQDHILSWSNPDDLVFDPMCGSGTVGKMALIHGRRFIGVDISAEYIEIARKRLNLQGTIF